MAHSVRLRHRDWRQRGMRSHNAHRQAFAIEAMVDVLAGQVNLWNVDVTGVELLVKGMQAIVDGMAIFTILTTFNLGGQQAAQDDL